MHSFLADIFVNPVIRQARRISDRTRRRDDQARSRNSNSNRARDQVQISYSGSAAVASAGPVYDRYGLVGPAPPTRLLPSNHMNIVYYPNPAAVRYAAASPRRRRRDRLLDIYTERAQTPASVTMASSPPSSKRRSLPEDDGMGALRKRLLEIQSQDVPGQEKARLMHETLTEGYRKSQTTSNPTSPGSPSTPNAAAATTTSPSPSPSPSTAPIGPSPKAGEAWEQGVGPLDSLKFWQNPHGQPSDPDRFSLTADDIKPTYVPPRRSHKNGSIAGRPDDAQVRQQKALGCSHYRRNVKLQCSICSKWYTCRFCHDAVESHNLIRKDTKNMLCMLCACPQKAGETCVNCGHPAARYFCNVCKLWDDHPDKDIYHCNDCGICRRGQGLGKDFFHCKKCCACISISIQETHKCIERSTDCDCPICGEYMFTSPKAVVFMNCGHSIHSRCYNEHMMRSYKCPICNKSLVNMETQFRQIDLAIQSQPMPLEFRNTKTTVLCNDCSGKSTVAYHWLGLKCAICNSYNTVELQMGANDRDTGGGARASGRGNNNASASNEAVLHSAAPATASQHAASRPRGEDPARLMPPPPPSLQSQQPSQPQTHSDPASGALSTNTNPNSDAPAAAGIPIVSRSRRHSAQGGPERRPGPSSWGIPAERMARSTSPPLHAPATSAFPWAMGDIPAMGADDDDDDESEEDMLGLWATRSRDSRIEEEDDDDFESDEADFEEEEEEEEDDDDDHEIMLIGHR